MWKLATSLWGDQDKPLILEPRRRIKGHPFLSCIIEIAKRRVSNVSAGALGLEVHFPPARIEGSRSRDAPGAPRTVGRPSVPVRPSPETHSLPPAWRGFSVLGMGLGFALVPGRTLPEQRAGARSDLQFWWEGRRTRPRDPQLTRRVAALVGGARGA